MGPGDARGFIARWPFPGVVPEWSQVGLRGGARLEPPPFLSSKQWENLALVYPGTPTLLGFKVTKCPLLSLVWYSDPDRVWAAPHTGSWPASRG